MLKDIIGHTKLINFLLHNLRSGQTAHAYILQGASGIGKQVVARAFAQAFLCLQPEEDGDGCQNCKSCYLFQAGTHPDFILLQPEGTSIKIEQVRQLQQLLVVKPALKKGRVLVIEQAEKMTAEAANSLLKAMEEPPPGTLFLLLTERPRALLETIRSRCQALQFYPLSKGDMQAFAKKIKPAAEQEEIENLLVLAEGIPGKLEEFLMDKGQALSRRQVIAGLKELDGHGLIAAFKLAEEWEKEKETIPVKVEILLSIFRDILVQKVASAAGLALNRDCESFLQEMGQRWSQEQVQAVTDSILKTQRLLSTNVNVRLLLEWLFIKIARYGGYINGESSRSAF